MAKDKDYLKYCKYYKGEKECPPDLKYRSFWFLERNYFCSDGFQDKKNRKHWEEGDGYKLCLETFPELTEFIWKQDKVTRGFLACSAVMSYSHAPAAGVKYLLDYGKK